MTSELRDRAIEINLIGSEGNLSVPAFGREDYFAYYYAYAKPSGKLLHARRTPHP